MLRVSMFIVAAAALLTAAAPAARAEAAPAKAGAKAAAKADDHPAPALYVKEKDGSYRAATSAEAHPAAAGGHGEDSKTSFIDLKRYDLGIYTLLVFGALYLFIQTQVWPKIATGLKAREAAILGAREDAQKDRADAKQSLVEAKRQLDEAADKAKGILDAAHKQAEAGAARAKDEAAKAVEAAREQSRREIESAKQAARQELYQEAVQLASMLSAKTIRRQLTPEDHRQLLDDALADLKTGLPKA